jgi:MoaA/NifB/PqqE/SkfB family radical SAM enzyme
MKRLFEEIKLRSYDLFHDSSIINGYKPIDKKNYKSYNKFRPEGPKKLFCYVPFNNMTFSFRGRVLACAYNQKVELGRYPNQSLTEMWFNSEMGNKLRDHMEHNDLSFGCKHCKYFLDNQKFSGLKPLVYDKYSDYKKTKSFPKVLEFELSNTCNFECIMCNGEVSSSIRQNRDKLPPIKIPYDDAFIDQLIEFIPHIEEAKFYGGEPFLIPIYFKIWELIIELNPKVKMFVITNGSTLNSRVKNLIERGNFNIGVSVDSVKKDVIESIRLNVDHEILFENIKYFNDSAKKKGLNLTISFTMMRINWREFVDVIHFCNNQDAILYVSYLKTPPQYALWNLPLDDLKNIFEELKDIKFTDKGYVQENNARCFEDFLTYLENCIEDCEAKQLNPNPQHKNSSEDSKQTTALIKDNPIELKEFYNEGIDYKSLVYDIYSKYFDNHKTKEKALKTENFLCKVETSFDLIDSQTKSINKLYFIITKSEIEKVATDVTGKSAEELSELMKQHV